jgi:uncharacterized membrane protein YeaQ/YmgE (transglycosylase-associated protein family)
MTILGWILLGLIAGSIAKLLIPGKQPGGCIGTTAIGVVGALIGGALGSAAGIGEIDRFFDAQTWALAIAGSVLLLLVLTAIAGGSRRRPPPRR